MERKTEKVLVRTLKLLKRGFGEVLFVLRRKYSGQYSLRFKIEVGFKSAIHTLGTYSYRFWMKEMKKTRYGDGTKYLHKETEKYRESYLKKLKAFHVYIQIGLIAQGLMQYLSMKFPEQILRSQGGWIRAIRPGVLPSEWVVSMSS